MYVKVEDFTRYIEATLKKNPIVSLVMKIVYQSKLKLCLKVSLTEKEGC